MSYNKTVNDSISDASVNSMFHGKQVLISRFINCCKDLEPHPHGRVYNNIILFKFNTGMELLADKER
jgi:hypothetical protein